MTRTFRTNLNCQNCVTAVRPHLDAAGLKSWRVDTNVPEKLLTVEGDGEAAKLAVTAAGFKVLSEVETFAGRSPLTLTLAPEAGARGPDTSDSPTTYKPIVLLVSLLILATGLLEVADGAFHWHRAMPRFMGGFFLAFAFFKLLDVRAFAASFSMYDLVAARVPAYGLVYPFLELLLGCAYLANIAPTATNAVTLGLMLVGTAGVLSTMVAGRKVKCACLGAVFKLPMSYVTLAEDAVMAAMAAAMLI